MFCASNPFDIICITESWLSPEKCPDSLLSQNGKYSVFRNDRIERRGGGVCVLANSHFSDISLIDLSIYPSFSSHFECVTIDIIANNCAFRLICVYRPPCCTFEGTRLLCNLLVSLFNTPSRILLVGDFNFPKLNWESPSSTISGSHELFFSTVISNSLHQFVLKPTLGNNILDLVLCNDVDFVLSCAIAPGFSTSDHNSVIFEIDVTKPVIKRRPKSPDFLRANYDEVNARIASVDWSLTFRHCAAVDTCYTILSDIISQIIRDCVPPSNHVLKPYPYPRKVKLLVKHVKSMWKRRNSSRRSRLSYKNASVYLRKLCKRAKGNYEDTLVRTGNINKFYSYVNHKLKTKTDIGPIVNSNGILCVDDTEKCQLFSDQFSSVFVADDGNLPAFPSRTSSVFRFSLLSEYSVYEILRHLPPKISSSLIIYHIFFSSVPHYRSLIL